MSDFTTTSHHIFLGAWVFHLIHVVIIAVVLVIMWRVMRALERIAERLPLPGSGRSNSDITQ